MNCSALRWVLLVVWASVASAEDDPQKAFDTKVAPKLKALASHHEKIAKWAFQRGLRREACRQFMEVLELVPDDAEARKILGFKKAGDAWKLEGPLPKVDLVKGDERKKVLGELTAAMGPAEKQAGGIAYAIALEAEKLKLEEPRIRWLGRTLGYDKEHAKAREGLGYKKVDGRWIVAAQAARLNNALKEKLVEDEAETAFESELKLKLAKRSSTRMWIGGFWGAKEVEDMVRHGDAGILAFHDLFKLGSFLSRVSKGKQIKLAFVKDAADYEAFIEKYHDGDVSRKAFVKKLEFCFIGPEGLHVNRFVGTDDDDQRRDRVVYLVGNRLAHAICGDAPPWIAEGICWGLCLRILGTKFNFSVSMADTSTDYGAKNWNDHSSWRGYLREMVLLGDPPLPSEVLVTRDWNTISGEKAAYAWSMVDFLWRTQPEKFAAYCQAISGENKDKVEEACQSSFGYGMMDLDQAWREYVKGNY